METLFRDRNDAGQQLAEGIAAAGIDRPAVALGLPRGGVPVAAAIAQALDLPLNTIGVRKISTPERPELAIGAIAEGGSPRLDQELIATLRLHPEQVERATTQARGELAEAVAWLRAILPFPELTGTTALLVDDGIATGATIAAAADAVRQTGAASVVIASPYCSATANLELRGVADTVLCLAAPYHFRSVSEAYEEFESTSWDEVERLLRGGTPESD